MKRMIAMRGIRAGMQRIRKRILGMWVVSQGGNARNQDWNDENMEIRVGLRGIGVVKREIMVVIREEG